jgi:uncharacterized protein (DUF362 family)
MHDSVSSLPGWPSSPEEVDAILLKDVQSSECYVIPTHFDESAQQLMGEHLRAFLYVVQPKQFVLIKTSTTGRRTSDHEVATSLLEFVTETVVRSLPGIQVFVGDGPLYEPFPSEADRLGWTPFLKRFGASIVDLNSGDAELLGNRWPVAKVFLRAGCVINLCKAKTHRRFGVSLGTKGLLGVLARHIPGTPKLEGQHRYVPSLLSFLSQAAPPTFTIIDGIDGMEGEGPLNGTRTSSRFICFGRGFYGPDIRATVEMGFDPVLIPYFLRPSVDRALLENTFRWQSLRLTTTNFLPPLSCSWLYRSLLRSNVRQKTFTLLLEEMKLCWDRHLAVEQKSMNPAAEP